MGRVLDIDLLRTFHAIARSGRFKTAAERLHKSPAAISAHIQRLESVAGGRLLHRDNQSVALTPLGRRLLATTAELLSAHDRVLADLHGPRLAGRVALGVPDEYAAHVIGDILPIFAQDRPNVVLEVTTAPSLSLREQVRRGKLQAAVLAQPQGEREEGVQLLVPTAPVWVAAASGAPESGWLDPLPLAVYAAECPYRQAMFDALRRSGRRWRLVLESPSGQAVKACVEGGLAISMLDRARVTARMQILDDLPVIPEHEVVFMRSAASAGDEVVDLLADCVRQHFRL
ncbi:LysR family transcriptional regulator [Stutzerimonas urumqiensis]|uniref:LysR family transcriptional regulator n=1 Tax=Stutzerimonas urumqiensis TaxID=638269 RepID=UPI003BAC9C82